MTLHARFWIGLALLMLHVATLDRSWASDRAEPVIAPALAITNEAGHTLALLSGEAYRAEFRYLRRMGHAINLSGPARKMTGLQRDVPETQWPFMQFCYFGFACVNFASCNITNRDDVLEETRWLISALQTPRLTGFIVDHFGPAFGEDFSHPSVFVHGLYLNLLMRYREVSGDPRFDPLVHRIASALSKAFANSEQGLLPTYRYMWWPPDNLPALEALVRYDRVYRRDLSKVRERFLQTARAHYLDSHGILASYIDPAGRRVLQGARGVGISYALHFLKDIDPTFAQAQYSLAKREFFRSALGFAAVREFPNDVKPDVDVDSGAVFFGLGTAASGFGIAAAAVMGDQGMAEQLLKSSVVLGRPILERGELRYAAMPPVGQAVILFGKTELLKQQMTNRQRANP